MSAPQHRWAVVDVETSGLSPRGHRVLSVAAFALDERGEPEHSVVSLLNPGCDPGPVHIHGLTRQRLSGAPTFSAVLPELQRLLAGRVLVAHNAAFDHGFLDAEFRRAGATLPSTSRMCTLALSRRLGLEVADHKLGTLAAYWGVRQRAAHDAGDDALVLSRILTRSLGLATELGLPLPVLDVGGRAAPPAPWPDRVLRVPCDWANPGRFVVGARLVQGMAVAITGPTSAPRAELAVAMQKKGLDVVNSVSGRTSVVVCNDDHSTSAKGQQARARGVVVLSEQELGVLLAGVEPGRRQGEPRLTEVVRPVVVRAALPGTWAGRRVLVVGGTHDQAAATRREVAEQGGTPAVNFTVSVTDLLVLPGGGGDPRCARARERGLRVITSGETVERQDAPPPTSVVPVMTRGAAVDLPPGLIALTVSAGWRAIEPAPDEVDVVALVLGADEQVRGDGDLVFYNQPLSQDGAVQLSMDGTSEQSVRIELGLLGEDTRVHVAAALVGGRTFGDVGAIALSLEGNDVPVATAVLDAATTEQTLVLIELYRRRDTWRLRVVGQGYDTGLAELVRRHGVEVDES